MKTSPVPPPSKTYTVNFVPPNALLAEKVRSFFLHSRVWRIEESGAPLGEAGVDCYVVPCAALGALFNNPGRPDTWLPVIASGDRLSLPEAFALGCRDYLKEPWDPAELEIRLARAVRPAADAGHGIELEGGRVSTAAGSAALKPNEERILKVLLRADGEVVSREVLRYAIWGKIRNPDSRVVDVHVSALRRRLAPLAEVTIAQVRGEGYRLAAASRPSGDARDPTS